MDWTFIFQTRDELIQWLICASLSGNASRRTIAHKLCHEGGKQVLWSVVEITARIDSDGYRHLTSGESVRYIQCDLLDCHDGKWGYKGLEESMEPHYYSCPLAYLSMVKARSPAWRKQVRAYHTRFSTV
jgi:hypothetical protein